MRNRSILAIFCLVLILHTSLTFAIEYSMISASYSNVHSQNNIAFLKISSTPPYDSLQGLWEFEIDNSTTAFDFSSNSLNGAFQDNAYSSNGKVFFDGAGDFIIVENNQHIQRTSPQDTFSVCAKFNVTKHSTSYGAIASKYSTTGDNREFLLSKSSVDNTYRFSISIDGITSPVHLGSTSPLNENQEYVMCGVYNGTAILLYIDGILNNTNAIAAVYNSSAPFQIGAFNSLNFLNGSVSWVMYFSDSLNSTEIADISKEQTPRFERSGEAIFDYTEMTGNNVGIGFGDISIPSGTNLTFNVDGWNSSQGYNETYQNLLFYAHFDDDYNDYSPNGFQGTTSGEVSISSGKIVNASRFEGTNDFIYYPSFNPDVFNKTLTAMAWIKPLSTVNNAGIVGSSSNTTGTVVPNWMFRQATGNKIQLRGMAGTPESITSTGTYSIGEWSHVAVVVDIDNDNVTFYINGKYDSSFGSLNFTSLNNDQDYGLLIGTYKATSSYDFNGSIDEVMIFNETLSGEEIYAIYMGDRLNWSLGTETPVSEEETNFTGYSQWDLIRPRITFTSDDYGFSTPSVSGNLVLCVDKCLTINVLNNESTIIYPSNIIYNITTGELDSDYCWLSIDGKANVTMDKNSATDYGYNDSDVSSGLHTINFYCNDTMGDVSNEQYSFSSVRNFSLLDQSYTNSQGLDISFHLFIDGDSNGISPVVIVPDSWSSDKDHYADEAEYFKNNGFVGVAIETRGKGDSEGSKDAFGYECLDIIEAIEYLKNTYPTYVNQTVSYIWGYSAGGGKAGVCSSKYPDYFAAAYSTDGVLNITKWYETAPDDRSEIQTRVGFTPSENYEAFKSREASTLVYNTQTPFRVQHANNDPRVNVSVSRNFNQTMVFLGKEINYSEFSSSLHEQAPDGKENGVWWFNNHTSALNIPSSGDLRIGGYVVTKNFSVEFIDNVGKYGSVNYSMTDSVWTLNVSTDTYSERANITLNTVSFENYSITDNDIQVAVIKDDAISSSNSSYNVSIHSGIVEFTLPHMSDHDIIVTKDVVSIPEEEDSEPIYTNETMTETAWFQIYMTSASEEEIRNGYESSLREGCILQFKLKEEGHVLKVNSIFQNQSIVNLTLTSEPVNFNISIGETRKIDFNSDGIYDLLVYLSGISGSELNAKADLILREIHEKIEDKEKAVESEIPSEIDGQFKDNISLDEPLILEKILYGLWEWVNFLSFNHFFMLVQHVFGNML